MVAISGRQTLQEITVDLLMGLNQLIQCRKHIREANSE